MEILNFNYSSPSVQIFNLTVKNGEDSLLTLNNRGGYHGGPTWFYCARDHSRKCLVNIFTGRCQNDKFALFKTCSLFTGGFKWLVSDFRNMKMSEIDILEQPVFEEETFDSSSSSPSTSPKPLMIPHRKCLLSFSMKRRRPHLIHC